MKRKQGSSTKLESKTPKYPIIYFSNLSKKQKGWPAESRKKYVKEVCINVDCKPHNFFILRSITKVEKERVY
jgi:hypothetical protein